MRTHHSKLQRTAIAAGGFLAALIALIIALVWSDRKDQTSSPTAEELRSVVIQRPNFAEIRLELLDAQWQLTAPCIAIANNQRVDAFEQLLQPAAHGYAAAEVDLEAAGLRNPLATVVINGDAIEIGATDLTGERRYIQRNSRVEFAPEWILSLIQGGTSAFAQLDVFPGTLNSLSVKNGNATQASSVSELQQWQALTANQVITWPLIDNPPELLQSHVIEFDSSLENGELVVNQYDAFSAIVKTDNHCAYIINNSALPTL